MKRRVARASLVLVGLLSAAGVPNPAGAPGVTGGDGRTGSRQPDSRHPDPTGTVLFEKLVGEFGLDASDRFSLLEGEAIVREADRRLDEELCVRIAVLVPAPLSETVALYRDGGIFDVDPQVPAFGLLDARAPRREDLDAARWSAGGTRQVRRLAEAEGGRAVNLAPNEIARFREIVARFPGRRCDASASCGNAVVATLRDVLHERASAYRQDGLEAIAGYARSDGALTRPGAELDSAARGSTLLDSGPRGFRDAFLRFPRGAGAPSVGPATGNRPVGVEAPENRFFWIDRNVRDSSTLSLVHLMLHEGRDSAIAAERYFYVGHSYNASQGVNALVAHERGTVIFYENRTFTDQVTGFFPSLRRALGRRHLTGVLLTRFRAMQALVRSRHGKVSAQAARQGSTSPGVPLVVPVALFDGSDSFPAPSRASTK